MTDKPQDVNAFIKEQALLVCGGTLYWKGRDLRLLGCNLEMARIFGMLPEEIVGKTDFDILSGKLKPEQIERIVQTDREVIESGIEKTLEEEGFDIHGKPAYYLSTKKPIKDATGEVIGLVGVSLDITKQREAIWIRNEFMSNVRHDIRTPFCGLLAGPEFLLSEETDPLKREILSGSVDCAKALLDYLNQLLEFQQPLAEEEQQPFFLNELLSEVEKIELPVAKSKGLTLVKDCRPANLPVLIGKPLKIKQILLNLTSNAIKFTHQGKIQIIAELKDNLLIIHVKDSGIGIPKDKQQVIFEDFVRLTGSYQGIYQGVGLGLSTVNKLTTDLKGRISLSSEVGKGSIFTCMLPVRQATATTSISL